MGGIIDTLYGSTTNSPSNDEITTIPGTETNLSSIDRSKMICLPMSEHQVRCYLSLSEGQYGNVQRSGTAGPSDEDLSGGGHSKVMYVWVALCLVVLLSLLCGSICLWKRFEDNDNYRGSSGSFLKYRRSTSYKLFNSKTRARRSHSRQSSHNKTKKSHKTERKASKRSSKKKK